MLEQGTNRLNQGHDSDGSGWGSKRTGLARVWWRLSLGSVRAQIEVQWLGLETLNWGAGNGSGTGSRRWLKLGDSGNGGGRGWELQCFAGRGRM